jgi:hypothetical protein
MGVEEFLAAPAPAAEWSKPLTALWWMARDDWEKAHDLVKEDASAAASWVHAHLHRVEGDESNAAYWYSRAEKPVCSLAPEAERAHLIEAMLAVEF